MKEGFERVERLLKGEEQSKGNQNVVRKLLEHIEVLEESKPLVFSPIYEVYYFSGEHLGKEGEGGAYVLIGEYEKRKVLQAFAKHRKGLYYVEATHEKTYTPTPRIRVVITREKGYVTEEKDLFKNTWSFSVHPSFPKHGKELLKHIQEIMHVLGIEKIHLFSLNTYFTPSKNTQPAGSSSPTFRGRRVYTPGALPLETGPKIRQVMSTLKTKTYTPISVGNIKGVVLKLENSPKEEDKFLLEEFISLLGDILENVTNNSRMYPSYKPKSEKELLERVQELKEIIRSYKEAG